MIRSLLVCALAGLFLATTPQQTSAQQLPIDAFYGYFSGSGIAENSDSLYFGVTVRDLDVTIGPEGNGFYVEWISIIRGGGDPAAPNVRERNSRMSFELSARPGIFRALNTGSPLTGEVLAWASIANTTLTVHIMAIRDDGGYEINTYSRTLSGTGMDLNFTSRRNGESIRTVEGRLVKTAN